MMADPLWDVVLPFGVVVMIFVCGVGLGLLFKSNVQDESEDE